MIMRTWWGAARSGDADRYLEHQANTGIREYRQTPGNRGALVIRRDHDGLCEVTTVSLWDSMDSVRAFAGEDLSRAKFYPGDEDLLVEKDLHVDHYDVVSADLDIPAMTALARCCDGSAGGAAATARGSSR